MENGADRVIKYPNPVPVVVLLAQREPAPPASALRQIAQPSRFEFQGVKYQKVECWRIAFVVPALS